LTWLDLINLIRARFQVTRRAREDFATIGTDN